MFSAAFDVLIKISESCRPQISSERTCKNLCGGEVNTCDGKVDITTRCPHYEKICLCFVYLLYFLLLDFVLVPLVRLLRWVHDK